MNQDRQNDRFNNFENHTTELDFPSYTTTDTVVTIQPLISSGTRRPIPILTQDAETSNISQFIPMQGLDFLSTAEQLLIQQTVELDDLLAHRESENRYTVKIPRGETIYYATETSSSFQRTCFGPSRAFTMKLFDRTQQEALELKRRLACGACSIFCYLQRIEVWNPASNHFIGTVEQKTNVTAPIFLVFNNRHDCIYRIEGTSTFGCVSFGKDTHFKLYSSDGLTQVGSIHYQWDEIQSMYNLSVLFPNRSIDITRKALLLAAGFLLEYTYFTEKRGCKCSC